MPSGDKNPMDRNLLVIRADASSVRNVIDGLRDRGYTVITLSNFELTVDPTLSENFDLIIVEHAQNRINALEICAELRQRSVENPVIVVADQDLAQHRVAIFKAGGDDYLLTPFDLDELQARIEALLARLVRKKKPDLTSYEFAGARVDFDRSELIRDRSEERRVGKECRCGWVRDE